MIKMWRGLWFADGARLVGIGGPGGDGLPLVEVEVVGRGRAGTAGKRHVDGLVSRGFRYVGHSEDEQRLAVVLADPETGLRATACYEWHGEVLRCWAELTAATEVVVEHVSSFVFAGV